MFIVAKEDGKCNGEEILMRNFISTCHFALDKVNYKEQSNCFAVIFRGKRKTVTKQVIHGIRQIKGRCT